MSVSESCRLHAISVEEYDSLTGQLQGMVLLQGRHMSDEQGAEGIGRRNSDLYFHCLSIASLSSQKFFFLYSLQLHMPCFPFFHPSHSAVRLQTASLTGAPTGRERHSLFLGLPARLPVRTAHAQLGLQRGGRCLPPPPPPPPPLTNLSSLFALSSSPLCCPPYQYACLWRGCALPRRGARLATGPSALTSWPSYRCSIPCICPSVGACS